MNKGPPVDTNVVDPAALYCRREKAFVHCLFKAQDASLAFDCRRPVEI